jgi:hypothetical protein
MHCERNQIPIPTEEPERMLMARAVPDFTGTVTIHVTVLPTAAHEIEFRGEVERQGELGRSEEKSRPIVTNDRVNSVRRAIAENADAFFIGTKLVAIKASFLRGELKSFKICEVETNGRPD